MYEELKKRSEAQGNRSIASIVREILAEEMKSEKKKGGELCGL